MDVIATQAETRSPPEAADEAAGGSRLTGLDISIRTGSGTGHTLLSAFDHAQQVAGVADFNLVTIPGVIPPGSRLRHVSNTLPGGHGDLLFCVHTEAFAEHPGDNAWAGLGWCVDDAGGGLFVEHHGGSEQSVIEQIELSLADMNAKRGGNYGPVQMALASAHCTDRPACALVVAAYRVSSWFDPSETDPDTQPRASSNAASGSHASTTSRPFSSDSVYARAGLRFGDDEVRTDLLLARALRELSRIETVRSVWTAHRSGLSQRQIGELIGRSQPDVGRTIKRVERDESIVEVSAREVALRRAIGGLPDRSMMDWLRLSIPQLDVGEADPSPAGDGYLAGRWDDVRQLHREGLITDAEWEELFALKFGTQEDVDLKARLFLGEHDSETLDA